MASKASGTVPTAPKKPSQAEIDSTANLMAQAMDLVRLQMRRIKKDIALYQDAVHDGKADEAADSWKSLFIDVHYMLISLHNVEQLFARLKRSAPNEMELIDIRNRYRQWLKKCSEFRVHIDLSDAKAPVRTVSEGRLEGGRFCMNGHSLNIGTMLEGEIEAYFRDMISAWAKVEDRRKKLRDLISKREELAG